MKPTTMIASLTTFALTVTCWFVPFLSQPNSAYSYSQDVTSCSDPRTQFPTNPPCLR